MSFRKTAAALMLSLLFLCLLFSASAQDAAHTAVPRNGLIFVNGRAHAGTALRMEACEPLRLDNAA